MENFDKQVAQLAAIFMKYLKYKKIKDVNFSTSELAFFLKSDQHFMDICKVQKVCNFNVDIELVKDCLSKLSTYIEKDKLYPLESRLSDVSVCSQFGNIVNDLFILIIDHYETITKSLNTTWSFFHDLMDKIDNTHTKVINSMGDRLEVIKSDTESDKHVLGMVDDISKVIDMEKDIEKLKSTMLGQMNELTLLIETNLNEKQERLKMDADEFGVIKQNINEYKLQADRLRANVEKYRLESITDYLTGLYNRKYMNVRLEEEQERSLRLKSNFSLIMMDIDDFKNVNDVYGHIVGDYVLKYVSKIITSTLRKIDVAFRYGGEEFLILLPETDTKNAILAAERLRAAIKSTVFKFKTNKIKISVSQGVSEYSRDEEFMDTVGKADKNLIKAKQSGKDRVICDYF